MSQTQISPPPASPTPAPRTSRGQWLFKLWDTSGMLLVLVVMFVLAGAYIENFATGRNMAGLLLSVTTIAFIACTMMLCLASGDFDLSVGAVVAVAGMMCVVTINHTQHLGSFLSIGAGIVVGLAAGAAVGLVNGLLIAKANINALIATLGTMQIVRGIAFLVSDGKAVGVSNDDFAKLGTSSWPWHGFNSYYLTWAFEWQRGFPWLSGSFWWEYGEFRGISTPVLIMAAFFVVFGILLNRTTFGRNSLAIGGNKEAARLAGIAVDRTKIIIFTLQGLAAAFAGIILTSRLASGQPNNGMGLELQAISACVLGGVSLYWRRGHHERRGRGPAHHGHRAECTESQERLAVLSIHRQWRHPAGGRAPRQPQAATQTLK